jgi:hypothetical protein
MSQLDIFKPRGHNERVVSVSEFGFIQAKFNAIHCCNPSIRPQQSVQSTYGCTSLVRSRITLATEPDMITLTEDIRAGMYPYNDIVVPNNLCL